MKKKILFAAASVFTVLILCWVVLWLVPFLRVSYTTLWKHNADFANYKTDFCIVKDYAAKCFPSPERERYVYISSSGGSIRLFDPDTQEYADIPDEVKPSLEALYYHAFPDKDARFNIIRINGTRIEFCGEGSQYKLVYSPDKKPSRENMGNGAYKIRVKEIGDGWYHVVAIGT